MSKSISKWDIAKKAKRSWVKEGVCDIYISNYREVELLIHNVIFMVNVHVLFQKICGLIKDDNKYSGRGLECSMSK